MKRFLALFAVMAMIVSMFSGVVFAAITPGSTYTLAVDEDVVVEGSKLVDIAVTGHAELDGYTIAVYKDDDSAAGIEKSVPAAGNVTLTGEDLDGLAAGTYTVNVKDAVYVDPDYFIDENDNGTYEAASDAIVVPATFEVVTASIENITAGETRSEVKGSIKSVGDITGDMLSLKIKDTDGEYKNLEAGCLENASGSDLLVGDLVVDASAGADILNVYIDTVEILLDKFDSVEGSGMSVWEYFSKHNSTGTIDLRLVVAGANIGGDAATETIEIDFTYSAVPLKIELNDDNDIFYYDENGGKIVITGKIINNNSEATYDYDTDNLAVYTDTEGPTAGTDDDNDRVFNDTKKTGTSYVVEVNNGQFDITFNAYNDNVGVDFLWIYSEDTEPVRGDYFFTVEGADNFALTPEFELDSDLELSFPFDGNLEIDGVFINDDNEFDGELQKDTIILAYLDDDNEYLMGAEIAKAALANKSSFGFLDSGDKLTLTGDIGLFFNGVRVMKGEVTAGKLTVDASTKKLQNNLGPQDFTLTFDLGSDYFDDDDDHLVSEDDNKYQLILAIENDDEDNITLTGTNVKTKHGDPAEFEDTKVSAYSTDYVVIVDYTNDHPFTDASDQEVDVQLPVGGLEKGTYTAFVKLYDDEAKTVVQEAKFEFDIKKPSAQNLIGWGLDEIGVGKTTFSFDSDAEVDQTVVVKDEDGNEIDYIEVIFNGCGLDDKDFATKKYDPEDGVDEFDIDVKETGKLTVKIHVYDDEGEDTPDKTFTEEIDVTGWNVEINPEEILVNSEDDVVFVITDEDGDPVNNAVIVIDGKKLVDSGSANIIGGVYTYEVDEDDYEFDNVGELDVYFYKGSYDSSKPDDYEVKLEGGIEVIGDEVYSVTAVETTSMINGLEEEILISVLDEEGDIVYPTFYRIDVDDDGDESSAEEITGDALGSYKDVDGVKGKEARKITLLPDSSQQAIIIRATTDDGEKMGEVRIEVQKPQLVMEMGQKLTENFKNVLEFTVIDPRDNSVLEQDLYLKAKTDYVHYEAEDAEESEVTVDSDGKSDMISFDETYKFEVYVNDVDWDTAEDDEEDVEISLYIELDEDVKITDLAIEKASLTADPEKIIMGAGTNITLTYTDANGKLLEGYDIELDDSEVGETDENGQVVYAASSTSSVSLTFKADTDDSKDDDSNIPDDDNDDTTTTDLKVKSSADTQPPVATYEVNGTTAIITITDNVRILKSFVDGVEVDMFFPMPTVSHVVTGLKIGDNNIQILASDTKNNILDTTLVITLEPTAEPVEFTIGKETAYGTPVLKADTTMVPVRFAQNLGAAIEWDNVTQTVTYTLGETKIAMTIGSKTAVVNGNNVQLPVAPYKNELARTMVPLRMIAQELGFTVEWTSNDAPITIK